jgi:type III restriction enzyme
LQAEADQEKALTGEYIRPILLLQAQPDYANRTSINVETVQRALREQFHIPDEQIAVATGTERGLDGVDVLSPTCKLRFIITVAALKEGWDCSFAYVLYSVADLTGARGVEQILGRVLRMPNASRKQREALNASYACVASMNFAHTARALKEGLVQSGFEKQEVDDLVINRGLDFGMDSSADAGRSLFPVSVTLKTCPSAPLPLSVLGVVTWDEQRKTLTLEQPLSPKQETDLVSFAVTSEDQSEIRNACAKQAGKPTGAEIPTWAPPERGMEFAVPVLALKQNGLFRQLEEDDLLERMEWSLDECDVDVPGFLIPDERRGIVIDISDKEKLRQDFIPINDRQLQLLHVSAPMSVGQLVKWLDHSFVHLDLTDAETGLYLTRLVGALIDRKGFSIEQLTAHRHPLSKVVADKIGQLRQAAKKRALESLLFPGASQAVFVNPASMFRFDPNKYPYSHRYDGLPFRKHYYEVVGDLDNKGEEYDCARLIDSLDGVEFWVRNLEREPEASFWIQTSSDRFYPDFVCKLQSGKILVVEYKGGRDATSDDAREKDRLGQLWAERSEGTCLFLMVRTPQEFGKIAEAAKL